MESAVLSHVWQVGRDEQHASRAALAERIGEECHRQQLGIGVMERGDDHRVAVRARTVDASERLTVGKRADGGGDEVETEPRSEAEREALVLRKGDDCRLHAGTTVITEGCRWR